MTTTHARSNLHGFPGGRPRLPFLHDPTGASRTAPGTDREQSATETAADDTDPAASPPAPSTSAPSTSAPSGWTGLARTSDVSGDVSGGEVTGGFFDYYSTESLFAPTLDPDEADPDDPYVVLDLTWSASWAEVSRRHRDLMKEFHPDRHVHSDEATRLRAEQRVRDVNEAYARIRDLHGR